MPEETGPVYYISDVRQRRLSNHGPRICEPAAVYKLMRQKVEGAQREKFYTVCLNTKNEVLRVELISLGSLNASIVHPREVLTHAFGCEVCRRPAATGIILVHNHPSGDPEPSKEDIDFTHRMAKCGVLMGITLLDHVIIGQESYLSLREQGVFDDTQ